MTNNEDNFEWARQLECPISAITDSVKKSLNRGILSLLWDELAGILRPTEEVLKIRKNILLYKLKYEENDICFQHIQNTVKFRIARIRLDPEIEDFEKKCKDHDFSVRQKYQQLSKIKSQRRLLKIKEDLLRMKLDELKTEIKDCNEMCSVCKHFMPANNHQINPYVVNESLALVSTFSTGADRKMVLNRISENFDTIDISIIWNILLSMRTRDNEDIIELDTREIFNEDVKSGEYWDISIAKARGRYIVTAVQEQICHTKTNEHERQAIKYIEKIEAFKTNNMDISEWLALSLEVRKLETEQKFLEMEIDHLKKTLEQQFILDDEKSNLKLDMHSLYTRMNNCIEDIKKSLILLKPAGSQISRIREKLLAVIQEIVALREEKQNSNYLDIDTSMELNIFHNKMQLEALEKIVLKDNVGVYRHSKFCISEALRTTIAPSHGNYISQFPMIRSPVYELINCYKILTMASWLSKLENESNTNERYDLGDWITPITQDSLIELLDMTDLTCDRVREEIIRFTSILDSWKYQTVQKAMTLDDRIVNGASFNEWVKRYDVMLHMIRKNK